MRVLPPLVPSVATDGVLLLQVPPPVASLIVIVEPVQTVVGPEIEAGSAITERLVVATAVQPAPAVAVTVYNPIIAVVTPAIIGFWLLEL